MGHEDRCETVEIESKGSPTGFVVINKSDLKDGDVVKGEKKAGRPKKEKGE